MHFSRRLAFLFCVALAAAACGCNRWNVAQGPERRSVGCVIFLPGIEGESATHQFVLNGLMAGQVRSTLVLHDWTSGHAWEVLRHLRDEKFHRDAAEDLAQRIIRYQESYPGRPVQLVGHSGGAGIVVKTLERLPAGRSVSRAVLMSPALSPDYDLTKALSRCRHGMWSYHSELDWAFVGAGTTLFGTMDGVKGSAAGRTGFHVPPGVTEEGKALYERNLHQVPFQWEMLGTAHLGGHSGYLAAPFIAGYISPLLREAEAMDDRPLRPMGGASAAGLAVSAPPRNIGPLPERRNAGVYVPATEHQAGGNEGGPPPIGHPEFSPTAYSSGTSRWPEGAAANRQAAMPLSAAEEPWAARRNAE